MTVSLPNKDGKQINSLDRAFNIIEIIGWGDNVNQRELADRLELSKSSIHYYLRTLEANRYVVREADGYRLGLRCLALGEQALNQHGFPKIVEVEIDHLANETDETALFAVEEGGKSVFVHRSWPEEGTNMDTPLGTEHYLHATAFGKAIMTHLPREDVSRIVDHHGLPSVTGNTISDREALLEELADTRELEVAFDDGENAEGVRSIAAPVLLDDGEVYGAVGIVGKADDLDDPHTHTKAQRFAETPSNVVKRFAHIIMNKLGDQ